MEPHRVVAVDDAATGLRAVIVLDSVVLGPAAGGVRTWRYARFEDAVADAHRLARAMTVKCAVAGLDAGGGKAVVWDQGGGWDRAAGFERLGEIIDELGGAFRTAGDLGTGPDDLERMARRCRFVHTGEADLARSVARGLLACVAACLDRRGRTWPGLRVAVQGAGAIGAACARALAARGAHVMVADVDAARAGALAAEITGEVVPPADILSAAVDIVCPCAAGAVLTRDSIAALRAWAVVGAANNIVAGDAAAALVEHGALHVPDVVASAGAVVDGIGATVMGLADRAPLIDRLGAIAGEILDECARTRAPADAVAAARADRRLALGGAVAIARV